MMLMLNAWHNLSLWLKLCLLFPLLCLNVWLLTKIIDYCQPLISFIIIATLLAFLLELLVKILQQRGISRGWAIATVLLGTLTVSIVLGVIILPTMIAELNELVDNAPIWIRDASHNLKRFEETPLAQKFSININNIISQGSKQLINRIETLGGQVVNIALGTITSVINIVIILIFTIFLLIGGEDFWDGIFNWLPSPWHQRVRFYIYQRFKSFFVSRALLALIASGFRAIIFILLGLPYALLFAFGLGIASLAPLLGGIATLIITLLLALNNGGDALKFFIAASIIDQLTDNVIAPRIMGQLIGLNPIWILISLFIGAKLGGILGVFLAVPVASVIKEIINDLRYPERLELDPESDTALESV